MVIDFLVQFRWLWLSGRPGGGKTSLGIYLANLLVKLGYAQRIAINTPLLGLEPSAIVQTPAEVHTYEHCAIILDEAWLYIGKGAQRKEINEWLGYIRKGNNYLIAPSVLPLCNDFKVFQVQRQFNGLQLGLPFWRYIWKLDTGVEKDKGAWVWWNPAQVFGSYDHRAKPEQQYYIYEVGQIEQGDNQLGEGFTA